MKNWKKREHGEANKAFLDGEMKWIAVIQYNGELMPLMQDRYTSMIVAAPDMLKALEASEREYADLEDQAPVDAGCIECTAGTVPNKLNTGLCAHHLRVNAISKARSVS